MRHLLAFTTLALALSPAAFAQDADTTDTTASSASTTDSTARKRVAVVGGYALSEPTRNPEIAGTRARVDGDGAATLGASYYVTDNIAVEAWGAADKFGHRVGGPGGKLGSVQAQPYAVSGQYHFRTSADTVRPFVGLGYYEQNFSGETAQPGAALAGRRIGIDTAKGAMATAGVDVNLTPTWFARADARYLHGDADIELDGAKAGDARLEPVIVGVGIGARF